MTAGVPVGLEIAGELLDFTTQEHITRHPRRPRNNVSYLHIDNLFRNQDILVFKEVYAMEKIHGTSAHVSFTIVPGQPVHINFFSGEQSEAFVKLFDVGALTQKFLATGINHLTVFGEAYGGKCQGMSKTYGKDLKFVVFDVKVGEYCWLSVPDAEQLAVSLGFEFVHYAKVSTDIEVLDAEKNKDSVQAVRNGMGEGHMREGIVLRPLFEVKKNNGERVIVKHKRDEFRETETVRKVSPDRVKVISDAKKIANEWVTEMRLNHVLSKLPHATGMEHTRDVIFAMLEDVEREAAGEIVFSQDAKKSIGARTATLFKQRFKDSLGAL